MPVLPLLLLSACGFDPGIEGTLDFVQDQVQGTLSSATALGYAEGGRFIAWISHSPDATCQDAATWLDSSTAPTDLTPLFGSGDCGALWVAAYPESGTVYSDAEPGLTTVVNCALGEGSWVYETHGDDTDWYWSGHWWQGFPTAWTVTVEGSSEDDPIRVEALMDGFLGNFIYEDMGGSHPADGGVTGSVTTTWCPELARASVFAW